MALAICVLSKLRSHLVYNTNGFVFCVSYCMLIYGHVSVLPLLCAEKTVGVIAI